MSKFYRYLIYKLYNWRIKKKDITPVATVIILLAISHSFYILILYSIIHYCLNFRNLLVEIRKEYLFIAFFIFAAMHYFLFYNKKKWELYVDEFKNETVDQAKKGKILVLTYLMGSIVIFFILMPILYGF